MKIIPLTVEVEGSSSVLQSAWDLVDSKPLREGSVGPLNRDELYERGASPYGRFCACPFT